MPHAMQQPPIRNANLIGVSVYSHSGEFAPGVTDLRLPGRGIDLVFSRSYRSSLAGTIADLGRGWSTNVARRIESAGNELLYHDGNGSTHRFESAPGGGFVSPLGLYAVLEPDKRGLVLRHRHGFVARYDPPDRGGHLRRLEDRNRNAITFTHRPDGVTILDTLSRIISVTIGDGLMRELRDHTGRVWTYRYDDEARLVEIVRPSTTDFLDGTSVLYTYDDQHRITSITNPNGQVALINRYDEDGRVIAQEQGDGAFRMTYEAIGRRGTGARRLRTACRLTNGGTVTLEHNDLGNVTVRTHWVRRESFAAEDLVADAGAEVPVITTTRYNSNGEQVEQTRPAGNRVTWSWADKDSDPRNYGNLRRVTELPASGVAADQTSIVMIYELDPQFQFPTAVTDPRGNTTRHRYDAAGNLVATTHPPVSIQPVSATAPRPAPVTQTVETTFTWNSRGQLLSTTAIDGSVATYDYYPLSDPIGARGPSTATSDPDSLCGYLARITRRAGDRLLRIEYGYDVFGNVSRVLDGKGNPSHLLYDALGRLERITGREPAAATVSYRYDANGNQVESSQLFERNARDAATGAIATTTSTIRELLEYDVLDRLVARTIVGYDRKVTERMGRDAAGRIARQVQPSGNTTEYEYDERDLLLTKTFAAGTKESFTHRYTWTPNGAIRTRTDGNGHTYTNRFDGFHRFLGFTDPLGTSKTQSLDAAGNVVRVAIEGVSGASTGRRRARADGLPLMEAAYHVDEWNRVHRIDRAWRDTEGRPLGSSGWADEPGVVSMLIEYADDGLPGALWSEGGNVTTVDRDEAGRIASVGDLTGETWSVDWDDNDNPTSIDYRQAAGTTDPNWTIDLAWDELDRLVRQQASDDAPRRLRYNAVGAVTGHLTRTGLEIRQLHDALGRHVGHAYSVQGGMGGETQSIVRGFEFDDTFRLVSSSDAAGNRTTYRYDALDRQVGLVYGDGTAAHVEYDGNGNVVHVVDQNGTETVNQYDAANRLVERRHRVAAATEPVVERFEYDPVGRLLAASGPGSNIARTYDSLSRPLTERQGSRTVRFETDAAGALTRIRYPGGEDVRRRHDVRRRITAVETSAGEVLSGVRYGPGGAVEEMTLGGVVKVACAYDVRVRLASIEYRSAADGTLIEGFRYAWDGAGRIAHEIRLSGGPAFGDRFTFDSANRPVLAQYGVRDVRDPASTFEFETRYEHFPESRWRRRVDRDGRGRVLTDRTGTLDARNRYRRFGDVSYTHDAAGNVTRKGTDNPGFCLYTYDHDNRLVKTECYDKNLRRTQLIEYFYDVLGRLVRKIVTDRNGVTTENTYVWAGTVLLEEYENGVLVRTYVYGLATRPARLTVHLNGRTDYVYVHDGRGQASGLVVGTDPNAFAERYGYEITGASFMKEIDGLPVDFPSRATARSSFLNAVLSDNALGGLRDWETGTLAGFGGTHIPQDIAEILNSVSSILGKSRKGLVGVLNDQMTGYLNWLGLGNARTPPSSNGPGGLTGGREGETDSAPVSSKGTRSDFEGGGIDFFGFGAGDTLVSETGFPFRIHGSKSKGPDMPFKPDWTLAGMHDGKLDDNDDPSAAPGGQGTSGGKGGDGGKGGPTAGGDKKPDDAPTQTNLTPKDPGGGGGATNTSGVPAPAGPKDPSDNALNSAVKAWANDNPVKAAAAGLIIQAIGLSVGGVPKGYVDPDQAGGVIVVSPEQIDMKLNGRKQPVNPNGGVGVDEPLDGSTIPPGAGGIDPTVALYDPDAMIFVASGDVPPKASTAPIDYAQGYGPGSPLPVTEGGSGDTTHTSRDRPY